MKFLLFSPIQAGPYTKENGTLAYFEVILFGLSINDIV